MSLLKKDKKEEFAVTVENVSKRFKIPHEKRSTLFENITGILEGKKYSYEEFCVLKNISFKVKKGETLGIIGENGTGKSTLLKIIAGVLKPDNGSVIVNGKIAPFLELGVGFQPELRAEDNVRLYGAVMGMNKKEIEDKFEDIFEFAELERFKNVKLKNFSSGMYARLAFSTAISTDPDVLLIDEVLAVGDLNFQQKCLNKINEFKKNKKTILFVSHDTESIKKISNSVLLLNKEKSPLLGVPDIIIKKYLQPKDNNIEKIISSKKRASTITLKGEIAGIEILDDNGNEIKEIEFGQKINIICKLKFNTQVINPVVGIIIRDKDGKESYNTNTLWNNIYTGDYSKGDSAEIAFECSNYLNTGTYSITIGLTDSTATEVYDWYDNFASFEVIGNTKSIGTANLNSNVRVVQR
ncbi:Trehalose/maltose import ATP-binding protein MalK [uncultured archaeon]|nr:Trehalose/maltose import ATP-binding protein MalK [uncultured archaeon]